MRPAHTLAPLALVLTSTLASAQALAHVLPGTYFPGGGACGVGDINGDGIGDLVLSSYWHVVAHSGDDFAPLWSTPAPPESFAFGTVLARIGDLDADGVDDLALGDPNFGGWPPLSHVRLGAVRLYSGASGIQIRRHIGTQPQARIGWNVGPAGDADADGTPDVFSVGWPLGGQFQSTRIDVFSGANGALLFRAPAFHAGDGFGAGAGSAGDVDGDGRDDLFVTAPSWSPTGQDVLGRVVVLSGLNGSVLRDLLPPTGTERFGWYAENVGDANSDGIDDLLLSAPSTTYNPGPLADTRIVSGLDGSDIARIATPPNAFAFGYYAARVGDVDSDGVTDVQLSYWVNWDSTLRVRVFSGRTGAAVGLELEAPAFDGGKTTATWLVNTCGDLNGDGREDLVMLRSYHGWAYDFLVTLTDWPAAHRYCVATTSAGGCTPEIRVSGSQSLTVGSGLALQAVLTPRDTAGAIVWSTSAVQQPFLGGTLCVARGGMSIVAATSTGGLAWVPCSGEVSTLWSPSYLTTHGVTPGTTIYAQFWCRDPSASAPTLAFSDAIEAVIVP